MLTEALVGQEGEGVLEGEGVFQAVIARAGADQGVQVGAAAQGFAQVPREGADVGAFAADDAHPGQGQAQRGGIGHVDAGRCPRFGRDLRLTSGD